MPPLPEHLHDVFQALGPVRIKRMFGGHGIWHDGLMCAIEVQGTLYLKTDPTSRPQFEAEGLQPFRYARAGQLTPTSYFEAPATVFEDRQAAAHWTRLAFEATLRAANARPARKPAAQAGAGRASRASKTTPPAKAPASRKAAQAAPRKAAVTPRAPRSR